MDEFEGRVTRWVSTTFPVGVICVGLVGGGFWSVVGRGPFGKVRVLPYLWFE